MARLYDCIDCVTCMDAEAHNVFLVVVKLFSWLQVVNMHSINASVKDGDLLGWKGSDYE